MTGAHAAALDQDHLGCFLQTTHKFDSPCCESTIGLISAEFLVLFAQVVTVHVTKAREITISVVFSPGS